MNDKKICPHLNCLVYHPDGNCTCGMGRYCGECKREASIPMKEKKEDEPIGANLNQTGEEFIEQIKKYPKDDPTTDWEKKFEAKYAQLIRDYFQVTYETNLEKTLKHFIRTVIAEAVREENIILAKYLVGWIEGYDMTNSTEILETIVKRYNNEINRLTNPQPK